MPSESELDDGWTRIDSGGVPVDRGGGVFFLRQQGADNDRLRADDAMGGVNVLRNILNGNSIGGPNDADALAEIEAFLIVTSSSVVTGSSLTVATSSVAAVSSLI